jgi:hypothetical protein
MRALPIIFAAVSVLAIAWLMWPRRKQSQSVPIRTRLVQRDSRVWMSKGARKRWEGEN